MSPPADCTLFFVLRPGAAALQARLLVASLREVLPTHLPIHAFLPAGDAPIDAATRKLMAARKVEMRPLPAQPGPAADHPAAPLLDAAWQSLRRQQLPLAKEIRISDDPAWTRLPDRAHTGRTSPPIHAS